MNHKECIAKIILLDLKLQCKGQAYVIITMQKKQIWHLVMQIKR